MEAVPETPRPNASAVETAVAIGISSNATGDRSIALGTLASSTAPDAVAIGMGALAENPGEVCIGRPGARVVICGQVFNDLLYRLHSADQFARSAYDRTQKLEKQIAEMRDQKPAIAAEALQLLGTQKDE